MTAYQRCYRRRHPFHCIPTKGHYSTEETVQLQATYTASHSVHTKHGKVFAMPYILDQAIPCTQKDTQSINHSHLFPSFNKILTRREIKTYRQRPGGPKTASTHDSESETKQVQIIKSCLS